MKLEAYSQDFKKFDVVSLGEAMVEFNQTQPSAPNYLQGFGGDTSNAVIAAARAGAVTAYLTRLGDDHFGRDILALFQRENVDTQAIETDAIAPTGIYFVHHHAGGHEFSYRRAGSAASLISQTWLAQHASEVLRQAKWFHVSGISMALSDQARGTTLAAMRLARNYGTQVSFDSNLRLKLWSLEQAQKTTLEALSLCDLFLPSLDDLTVLTGLTDPQCLIDWSHQNGAKTVVLKLGAQGCIMSTGSERIHIPARNVRSVDATGAGDCFCGNLLARLAAGDRLIVATQYANIAASLAVQTYGAVASLPDARAVQACRSAS